MFTRIEQTSAIYKEMRRMDLQSAGPKTVTTEDERVAGHLLSQGEPRLNRKMGLHAQTLEIFEAPKFKSSR